MLASFHRPETTTDWQRSEPPGLALADATRSPPSPNSGPTTSRRGWRRADRPTGRSSRSGSAPASRSRTTLLRACALTFISDVGLVSSARPRDRTCPAPAGPRSLDHALWLHRPVDPHQWHRYEAVALTHSDARGLARGSITAADGTLIASVAQESLWRI